jgi:hypothetical protein
MGDGFKEFTLQVCTRGRLFLGVQALGLQGRAHEASFLSFVNSVIHFRWTRTRSKRIVKESRPKFSIPLVLASVKTARAFVLFPSFSFFFFFVFVLHQILQPIVATSSLSACAAAYAIPCLLDGRFIRRVARTASASSLPVPHTSFRPPANAKCALVQIPVASVSLSLS